MTCYLCQYNKTIAIYVRETCTHGGDIKRSIDHIKRVTIDVPVDLPVAGAEIPSAVVDLIAVPPISTSLMIPAVLATTQNQVRIWKKGV